MVVSPCTEISPFRDIGLGVHHGSGQSVEDRDILRSIHDAPGLVVAVSLGAQIASPHVVHLGIGECGRERARDAVPVLPAPDGILALFLDFAQISLRVSLDGGSSVSPVGLGVADDVALTVNRSVGGLHHQFGFSVTIEVIHHHLRVMRTAADVVAQIDAPQPCAVKPVTVDIDIGRETGKHVVLGV